MTHLVSLTTGTTRGIGHSIFSRLTDHGDAYWINRSPPTNGGAGGWICDLSDINALNLTCSNILNSGIQFNCLVMNATYRVFKPIDSLSTDEFAHSMAVNVIANFVILKRLAPLLEKTRGSVVVCGSQAASYPAEECAAYCASKAALDMLARVFMYEYRHRGIRLSILEMGAVRNRQKPNDSWKIAPSEIADIALSAILTTQKALIARIEVMPREIPRGDEVGPERLHRI